MKLKIITLSLIVSINAFGQATKKFVQRASNQDFCLQVSPSGTAADAICIAGSSKIVSIPSGVIQQNGSANIVSADSDATLTSSSLPVQIYTGFTTTRNVTLPTTGILAGAEYLLINTALQDMVVKSSNGSALTIANSANADATVQRGHVRLRALVATPTTPANWLVLYVYEEGQVTLTFNSGYTTSPSILASWKRTNNGVLLGSQGDLLATTTGSPTQIHTATGALPLRIRPSGTETFKQPVKVDNAGTAQASPGCIVLESNGQVDLRLDYKSTAFSNGATTGYEGGWTGSYVTGQ